MVRVAQEINKTMVYIFLSRIFLLAKSRTGKCARGKYKLTKRGQSFSTRKVAEKDGNPGRGHCAGSVIGPASEAGDRDRQIQGLESPSAVAARSG
jgi:hypothetical protein